MMRVLQLSEQHKKHKHRAFYKVSALTDKSKFTNSSTILLC